MSLVMGIVGLPNVGKSSLFNALTRGDALVENRAFATIDPNLGVVKLMDPRVEKLASIVNPKNVVYSLVKFLDIAGLVKGASQGEGLGNKFLEHIRSVDAICLVVRAFEDLNIVSVNDNIDPVFEAEIVLCELVYSDLEMVENVLKKLKSNDPKISLLNKVKSHLKENRLFLDLELSEEERHELRIYSFLTNKPLMILANTDDSDSSKKYLEKIESYAQQINATFLSMNIKLENEISLLNEIDQKEFLSSIGKKEMSLNRLVALAFEKLNLRTFFTVGEQEVRAWTFKANSLAPQCAGVIHSDMERGFIKAEVAKYEDFVAFGGYKILKQHGKISIEGKDYVMQDGDIVHFKFNV